ncbi:hypothetical protein KKF81_00650 [Candidatus Micrarchaeota archaeon]|nr:hypothetical protein [Candidatus Micrarchaeota archaeon]MBU1165428.1 hypothetical protein [Candidatus Micrarchaeota archaeon]MBU1886975.1 hypothetical protein [Candidatus Micrarchaeota archaeon]
MIIEACVVSVLLIGIIIIAYFVFTSKPFKYSKTTESKNTHITLTANKNLHQVSVQAKFGNEKIQFERKKIKKGQTIDFVYPFSNEKATLTVVEESGSKPKVFDI